MSSACDNARAKAAKSLAYYYANLDARREYQRNYWRARAKKLNAARRKAYAVGTQQLGMAADEAREAR